MEAPTFDDISRVVYNGLVRLEVTGGVPTWEAMPGALHNGVVDDIRQSLTRLNIDNADCGCHHIADTYIQFTPHLLRRPDIALFCTRPPRPDGAITNLVPGAVVEVLSAGYEQKDRDAVALYLAAGVLDVILFDPRSGVAERHQHEQPNLTARVPVRWRLNMNCQIEIPAVV